MNAKELTDLISEGESSRVEFKRKAVSQKKLAKEISAFANTRGGWLIIGVDDDGSIVGVRSEKSEIDSVESACEFEIDPPVIPQIEIVGIKRDDVIVAYIPESKKKPHVVRLKDKESKETIKRAYIRLGEKSVIASREMYRLMGYQSDDTKPLRLSIGDKEKRLFAYLEKHEKATVKEFSKIVNISRRRAERLLINLVRAGVLQIHNDSSHDYFTLV